jgi:hypothetical protein
MYGKLEDEEGYSLIDIKPRALQLFGCLL